MTLPSRHLVSFSFVVSSDEQASIVLRILGLGLHIIFIPAHVCQSYQRPQISPTFAYTSPLIARIICCVILTHVRVRTIIPRGVSKCDTIWRDINDVPVIDTVKSCYSVAIELAHSLNWRTRTALLRKLSDYRENWERQLFASLCHIIVQ